MGLFYGEETQTGRRVQILIDVAPGLFYESDGAHVMFLREFTGMFDCFIGDRIPISCMFDVYWLMKDGERIGFWFTTQFKIINGGGYLCSFLESKKAKAEVAETLVKTNDLVIFHFPNRGTLIISPAVSPEVLNVIDEQ